MNEYKCGNCGTESSVDYCNHCNSDTWTDTVENHEKANGGI